MDICIQNYLEYVIMPNHIDGILWFRKYMGGYNHVGAIHELPLHFTNSPIIDNFFRSVCVLPVNPFSNQF
ncbi:hypothetical protein JCM12298_21730 [Desulfothermus naphthae]